MAAPSNFIYVNGGPGVSGDQLNTFIQNTTNVTTLRAFNGVSGILVYITGTSTVNDGGQGFFYWNASGVSADDNGVTTVIPTGSTSGEWTRLNSSLIGPITASQFLIGTLSYTDTGILGAFQSSTNSYNQFIMQNTNAGAAASTDFIVSNNLGTATTFYGDFGMNSSNFTGSGSLNLPNAVYVYSSNGDLVLGTKTANAIHFVYNNGATDSMTIDASGVTLNVPLILSGGFNVSSLNGGQLAGLRNRIINGAMLIDQRNAGSSQTITAAAGAAYTVDRFYATCTGANVTGQQVTGSGPDQKTYQFTGAASVTGVAFGQRIESSNIYDLVSTTATFSVKLANSLLTTVTWTAYFPTAADNWSSRTQIATGTFTVNSTPTVYSTQIALGANITAGLEIELTVGAQISGTWTITDFQLENGATATPFERRLLGLERLLSQRYFYAASVFVPSGASYGITCPRKATMRVTPTYAGGGSGFSAQNNNAETAGLSQTTGANQSLTLSAEL